MSEQEKLPPKAGISYFVEKYLPIKRALMLAVLRELLKDEDAESALSYCTVEDTKGGQNIVLTLYVSYGLLNPEVETEVRRKFGDHLAELMNRTEEEAKDIEPKEKKKALVALLGKKEAILAEKLAYRSGSVRSA